MRIAALDVGGTRLKSALLTVASDGTVDVARRRNPQSVAGMTGDEVATSAREVVTALANGTSVDAVGIAVPGVVDGGRVTSLPGKFPGLVGMDLPHAIGDDRPGVVTNDAVAHAVGEVRAGAGRGHDRVVVMTIGTGVGVCAIEAGRPLGRGAMGGGILGGQIPIGAGEGASADPDTSGRGGTIEALVRARRIEQVGLDRYRQDLAHAIVALVHAHAPTRVVVGGGPVAAGVPVLEGIDELVAPQLWDGLTVDVVPAELGDDAALVGLAHLAAEGAT